MSTKTIGKFVYKHHIDRDALLEFANNHKDGKIDVNDIARFPTADAVEVVRCKDCKHLMFSDCYGECSRAYLGIVSPNDYCSNGERREQE